MDFEENFFIFSGIPRIIPICLYFMPLLWYPQWGKHQFFLKVYGFPTIFALY